MQSITAETADHHDGLTASAIANARHGRLGERAREGGSDHNASRVAAAIPRPSK